MKKLTDLKTLAVLRGLGEQLGQPPLPSDDAVLKDMLERNLSRDDRDALLRILIKAAGEYLA